MIRIILDRIETFLKSLFQRNNMSENHQEQQATVITPINRKSVGQFNSSEWLKEGNGLYATSQKIREDWEEHRSRISEAIQSESRPSENSWTLLTGMPRASMLLLGYAAEMYLKAGLAKAYIGCNEEMFARDVKSKFGHKLENLANEVAFLFLDNDSGNLAILKSMVLVDARYPLVVQGNSSYPTEINKQTSCIWNSDKYAELSSLVDRLCEHVTKIDQDSSNPAHFQYYRIDSDGYLSFRMGGNLPTRITYKVSSNLKDSGRATLQDVRGLFQSDNHHLVRDRWEQAFIYEDGEKENGTKKTFCRQNSS